ncbi:isoflavone reductase like protein pcber1, partial [Quercus suber]
MKIDEYEDEMDYIYMHQLRRGLWHLYHQSLEHNWKFQSYSYNDLVSLWENKIGKTLKRIYLPKEQLLKNVKGDRKEKNLW